MAKKRRNHYHLTKVCNNGYLPTRFYPQSNAWYGWAHIHWARVHGLTVTHGMPLWHRVSKYANPIGNRSLTKACWLGQYLHLQQRPNSQIHWARVKGLTNG